MGELNLKYTYEIQRDRYRQWWQRSTAKIDKLQEIEAEDAFILPLKGSSVPWGSGGVLDKNGNIIEESKQKYRKGTIMGGAYDFDKNSAPLLPENEYVYLGFFNTHYGHMILDTLSRLYAIKSRPGVKGIFLARIGQKPDIQPHAMRMVELAGFNRDDFIFVNQPCRAKHIIVPPQSYISDIYYSDKYLDIFADIVKNIKPSKKHSYKKVFLSRSQFSFLNSKDEFGNEMLDEIFSKSGFTIVNPEEYSIDDQIDIINNADELALVQGSIIHSLIYTRGLNKTIYIINRTCHLMPQYAESIHFGQQTPIFLDFYTIKYPTLIFNGPFIYTFNNNMKNFIKDYNIPVSTETLATQSDANIYHYEFAFGRQKRGINYRAHAPAHEYQSYYYDVRWLTGWINDLAPSLAKSDPLLDYGTPTNAMNEIKKYQDMVKHLLHRDGNEPLLTYCTHVSMRGWLPDVIGGYETGLVYENFPIEAIKIKAEGVQIAYQVFYSDSGWTQPVMNGEMAGSTGKSRRINGLRIWLNGEDAQKYALSFRLFTNQWSREFKSGDGFASPLQVKALEIKLERAINKQSIATDNKMNVSARRINAIAAINSAKRYLEIGVNQGQTLLNVAIPDKTGVDPKFAFDTKRALELPDLHLFEMTSDAYFAPGSAEQLPLYDIIYIDGLHVYEQAMRDFDNSLFHSHNRTIWIFDDTVPCDPYSALPDQARSYKYRAQAGLSGRPWHGDVYKCVFALHDFYPDFNYATVTDNGNPQTVVWRPKTRSVRENIFSDRNSINQLSYFDMLDDYDVLHPMPEARMFEILKREFME